MPQSEQYDAPTSAPLAQGTPVQPESRGQVTGAQHPAAARVLAEHEQPRLPADTPDLHPAPGVKIVRERPLLRALLFGVGIFVLVIFVLFAFGFVVGMFDLRPPQFDISGWAGGLLGGDAGEVPSELTPKE